MMNTVEGLTAEIERLQPIYNQARRIFAQTKTEVLRLEETFPASADDVSAWIEAVAARAATLEAAKVLVERLNIAIEKLRKNRQGIIDDNAAREYHALHEELAKLQAEVGGTRWDVNTNAKKRRILQINEFLRMVKAGLA